jgi:predicted histone-like DNA-binding protein
MAVRYKLTKINDNITDNKTVKYSVTTVSYDNVNLDALAEQIAGSSTFSYGEVKGLVENLTILIAEALEGGNTVTIDGLGTFSVTARPNREVEDPCPIILKIRAESIKLKGIGFKPSPKLKERLRSIEFTRMK